jgi:hypothetical protein
MMKTMMIAAAMLLPASAAFADCGHRSDTRCTLEPGQPPQSTPWLHAGEHDWWRSILPGRHRFEAFVNDGGNGCSSMRVTNGSGGFVPFILYEHSDFNTSVRFTTPAAGTYYVVVVEAFCGGDTGIPMPAGYSIQLNALR